MVHRRDQGNTIDPAFASLERQVTLAASFRREALISRDLGEDDLARMFARVSYGIMRDAEILANALLRDVCDWWHSQSEEFRDKDEQRMDIFAADDFLDRIRLIVAGDAFLAGDLAECRERLARHPHERIGTFDRYTRTKFRKFRKVLDAMGDRLPEEH